MRFDIPPPQKQNTPFSFISINLKTKDNFIINFYNFSYLIPRERNERLLCARLNSRMIHIKSTRASFSQIEKNEPLLSPFPLFSLLSLLFHLFPTSSFSFTFSLSLFLWLLCYFSFSSASLSTLAETIIIGNTVVLFFICDFQFWCSPTHN